MVVDGKSDDGADDFGVSQRWQDGGGSSSSDADMVMLVFFAASSCAGCVLWARCACVRASVSLFPSFSRDLSLSIFLIPSGVPIDRPATGWESSFVLVPCLLSFESCPAVGSIDVCAWVWMEEYALGPAPLYSKKTVRQPAPLFLTGWKEGCLLSWFLGRRILSLSLSRGKTKEGGG